MFVVRNISAHYMKVDETWDIISDHSPILLTLKGNFGKTRPRQATKASGRRQRQHKATENGIFTSEHM